MTGLGNTTAISIYNKKIKNFDGQMVEQTPWHTY